MKLLGVALLALLVSLQYPLWMGKGSWLTVRDLDRRLEAQRDRNAGLRARNAALDAEVRDLKQGTDAIEERARTELGMIRQDEVFFQILDARAAPEARAVLKTPVR
jgi:cell division protein FtsB